jgi:hypothetical protein
VLPAGVSSFTARVKKSTTWPLPSMSVGDPNAFVSVGSTRLSNVDAIDA